MSEANLDRVREDLAVMRQATGLGLPFEWEHVWSCLALFVAGIVIAVITAGTGISVKPAVPGSASHLAYIGLLVVPVCLALGVMTLVARRRREVAPLFWRVNRLTWPVVCLTIPLYLGFTVWVVRNGLSASTLTAATFFLAGLFALTTAVLDRSKRYTLGFALSTMLAGAIAPLASYESAGLLAGGWLIVGGLSTAIVMAWQLRSEAEHVAD